MVDIYTANLPKRCNIAMSMTSFPVFLLKQPIRRPAIRAAVIEARIVVPSRHRFHDLLIATVAKPQLHMTIGTAHEQGLVQTLDLCLRPWLHFIIYTLTALTTPRPHGRWPRHFLFVRLAAKHVSLTLRRGTRRCDQQIEIRIIGHSHHLYFFQSPSNAKLWRQLFAESRKLRGIRRLPLVAHRQRIVKERFERFRKFDDFIPRLRK